MLGLLALHILQSSCVKIMTWYVSRNQMVVLLQRGSTCNTATVQNVPYLPGESQRHDSCFISVDLYGCIDFIWDSFPFPCGDAQILSVLYLTTILVIFLCKRSFLQSTRCMYIICASFLFILITQIMPLLYCPILTEVHHRGCKGSAQMLSVSQLNFPHFPGCGGAQI